MGRGTNGVNNWGYWVIVNKSEISLFLCAAESIVWIIQDIMQFKLVVVSDKSPTTRELDFVIDPHVIQNVNDQWSCPPLYQFTFFGPHNHTD